MFKKIIFLLILSLIECQLEPDQKCLNENSDRLILSTKSGKIKGSCSLVKINDVNESKSDYIFTWLSIPYAEAPINEHRFKPPKSIKQWSNVLDGTKTPNSCMQYVNQNTSERIEFLNMWYLSKNSNSKLSEDCLYLNIFASNSAIRNQETTKSPILIFFHGGNGGSVGSSVLDIYNPSVFSITTDIIVVTVNYRLDVFGFLHVKDDDTLIEGNQGFLDQHVALKWVYENSERFGGDPNRITLMGSDYGAKLIGYHLIFKPSWGLFRNAILQSGTPVNLAKNALSSQLANLRSRQFLKETLGCKDGKLVSCARKIDAHNLTMASRWFLRKTISSGSPITAMSVQSAFGPVVDGKLFKDSPIRSFRLENYKKCNILIGFNANEGASSIPFSYGHTADSNIDKANPTGNQVLNYTLLVSFLKSHYAFYPTYPFNNSEIILNSILHEYTKLTLKNYHGSFMLRPNYFHTLGKLLTDESYVCPTLKLIDYVAKKSKVYLYNYNYRVSSSRWPKWYGVAHGDEIVMVFGHPLNDVKNPRLSVSTNPWLSDSYSVRDKEISKELMTRWSSFIRDDSPNGKENSMNLTWPVYQLPNSVLELEESEKSKKFFSYFLVKNESLSIGKVSNLDKCLLWNSLIPANLDVLAEMKRSQTHSKRF